MPLRPFGSTVWHIMKSRRGEAHTAEQISFQPPAGMAASTVQEALQELRVLIAQSGGDGGIFTPTFYKHIQATPSATWTINHGLGFRPAVSLFNGDGQEIDGVVSHTSDSQVVVQFIRPVAGEAFLS